MKATTKEIILDDCRSKFERNLGLRNLQSVMPRNVLNSQMCAQSDGIDTCEGVY